VSFTATVTGGGGTPTGTVTFSVDGGPGTTVALGGGQATFTSTTLAVGNHTIQATYNGDNNFSGSGASLTQVVNQAATTTAVAASPNPSVAGQPVTFTATVSSTTPGHTPTGTVIFSADGNPIGTVTLGANGQAALTIATLAVGSHTITANYSGDGNFTASSGSVTQVVNKNSTTTLVLSSTNPSVFSQSVTFTAVLSPVTGTGGALVPSGTVTFFADGNSIGTGTLGSNGQATVSISTLAVGSHVITTTYGGDINFNGSNGTLSPNQQVLSQIGGTATTTTLVSSQNPSNFGQSVTFTATVTGNGGTPTGNVTFTDQTTSQTLGTVTLSGGKASFPTSTLTPGSHNVQATYNGDVNFATSTASLTQVVNKATSSITLTSTANPSSFGQSVTFTATVSGTGGTPTGSVTFTDTTTSQTLSTVTLTGGQAAVTTSGLTVGTHVIQANYSGDSSFSPNSTTLSQLVIKVNSTTTLTSSANPSTFGQSVTFTATVSGAGGTPTGNVTFTDVTNSQTLGTITLGGGQAALTISTLAGGSHIIQASYSGDNNFGGSSANLVQTVNKISATIKLTSSANPSVFGQTVTFTATVSGSGGTPTGSVTFTDLSTAQGLGTFTLTGGQATVTTSTLGVGTNVILAAYSGDSNFSGSSVSLNQVVGQATTTTTLAATPNPSTPGQSVTFTATVKVATGAGTPTGTVTFKEGTTVLGTSPLAPGGTAILSTSALTPGSHSIIAVYSGDTNFAGSTSAPLIEQVGTPADSVKLRELQISATPIIAQGWAQAVTAAMDDAVGAGFGGNPQALTPAGTGFTYYFTDDPPTQRSTETDQKSLREFLARPDDRTKRVDDDFRALGYAGGMPTKAPPPAPTGATRDWLAWISVRGFDFFRNTFGNDLKGDQVDAFAGLTRRITPNFVVGVLGGYEHFDYSSQAFNGTLKGEGWTAGAFLGWKLSPNMRFEAGGAWSDLLANGTSGTASGSFLGTRWLVQGGLTGTYPWQKFVLEPSARVFALWEHENAYTDSLGTFQPARSFETGRASAGVKAIYPFAWTSSVVALSPYAGLYADYYFSRDDAQTAGLTTVPLLQGWSARLTGGVAATFPGGASLGAGGEFGGIGSANHIWTWTARGRIPF